MKNENIPAVARKPPAQQVDLLVPILRITLVRQRWLWKSRLIVLVDMENGNIYKRLSEKRCQVFADFSSLFSSSEKEMAIIKDTKNGPRNQFQLRDRLHLTNTWTSRLLNRLVRRGLLVSISDGPDTVFGWDKGLQDLARFRGSHVSRALLTRGPAEGSIISRRFSGRTVSGCLGSVLGRTVRDLRLFYEPYRVASRADGHIQATSLITKSIRQFQPAQIEESAQRLSRPRARDGAFSGMGNETGWDRWTLNAHHHFKGMNARAFHQYLCPKVTFQSMIHQEDNDFYYHLCHGDSTRFQTGDGSFTSADEVGQWMESRPPMQFSFIGSCGAMEKTGPGTLSWAFAKGDSQCAVVGYVRMGELGNGWSVSLPWQDFLFTLAGQKGISLYESILRAQSRYPQMSEHWGFWGNRGLILKVRTLSSEPVTGGDYRMWKRASNKPARLSVSELEAIGKKIVQESCGEAAHELYLHESRKVVEEDTGAVRRLLFFRRRKKGILVLEDYASVELDPHDGSLIGFHREMHRLPPGQSGEATIKADQALDTARNAAEGLLRKNGVTYVSGSVEMGSPSLVITSKLPYVGRNRMLVYLIPVKFSRIDSEKTDTAILVDPQNGDVVGMIPPPPG